MLLRVAVVTNVMFGVFAYKAASSYAFLEGLLGLLGAPKRFINVGLVIRADETGVRGNFSLPVLWILTVSLVTWFVAHPGSFVVVFGLPLSIMKLSTFSWEHWTSRWLAPINIFVTVAVFWFGLIFGIVFWSFTFAIVVKAFSWLAEIIKPRFSKTVFDILALLLLAISGGLTFILI